MVDPKASRFWQAALQSGLTDAGALQACFEAIAPEKRVAEQLDRRQIGLLQRHHQQRAPVGGDHRIHRRSREHVRKAGEVAFLDGVADVGVLLLCRLGAPALHHP